MIKYKHWSTWTLGDAERGHILASVKLASALLKKLCLWDYRMYQVTQTKPLGLATSLDVSRMRSVDAKEQKSKLFLENPFIVVLGVLKTMITAP